MNRTHLNSLTGDPDRLFLFGAVLELLYTQAMRENLIAVLDQRCKDFENLFKPGMSHALKRLFLHPVKIVVRTIRLRVLDGKIFLVRTKTFFGYPMIIHSSESCLWFSGCLNGAEIGLQKYLIKCVQADTVFFDIGAHHGIYTLLAHRIIGGGSGEIHAFEPTDTHFAILEKNTKSFKNIHINKLAVSANIGKRIFYETIGAGSTIEKDFFKNVASVRPTDFHSIEVSCTTLDAYCAEHSVKPTLIKIDVEGSEYEVLSGGLGTLRDDSPIIAMEAWSKPYDNTNHIKAIGLLEREGFKAFQINTSGDLVPIQYSDLCELLEGVGNSNNFIFQK